MVRTTFALLIAGTLMAAAPSKPARSGGASPTTILIGQNWLGLWRGGRVEASRDLTGWQLGASRLSRDGRTLEVSAERVNAAESKATVLLFDAQTLTPRGRRTDPQAAYGDFRAPIGPELDRPDDSAKLRRMPAGMPSGGTRRVAVSPDGGTAAVFVRPAAAGAPWPGKAFDLRTGRALVAPGLSIDEGTRQENGAYQEIGCLLPRGEGVIYTFIGAPADRWSAFQRFESRAGPVQLSTPYVMGCLTAP